MRGNSFLDVMRERSNEELLEILNVKRNSYVADAISAVEAVLSERGVDFEKVSDEEFVERDERSLVDKISASKWKRFLGHIIDLAIIMTTTFFVLYLAMIATYDFSVSKLEFNLMYYFFFILYFLVSESTMSSGKTIGKVILRMSVVNEHGEKPSAKRIIIRCVCRFIPFDTFSFLLDWDWHDKLSMTYVADDYKLRQCME